MFAYFKKSRQTPSKTAENFDLMLLLRVAGVSSRVRDMDLVIAGFQFNDISYPLYVTTDIPSYLLDKAAVEHIIKRAMMHDFERVDKLEALARENRNKREEYEKKLDEILAQPIPEDEYQMVCQDYPMSKEEYLAAERAAAMLKIPRDRFAVDAKFHASPQPKKALIPEPVVLDWVADIRRELAAQSQSQR